MTPMIDYGEPPRTARTWLGMLQAWMNTLPLPPPKSTPHALFGEALTIVDDR